MAGGNCPNCKKPLSEQDRQRLNAPGPDWTGPSDEERRQRNRRCGRAIILTLCGIVLMLLSSPAISFRFVPPDCQWNLDTLTSLTNAVGRWSVLAFLVGWIVAEVGLVKTGLPLLRQVLARIILYVCILLWLAVVWFCLTIAGMRIP
jgi:hypothetical protein